MNTDIKTRWIAALRSGDYQQGYRMLNSNGKFCCLGVLCELAVADGIITVEDESEDVSGGPAMRYGVEGDSSITGLPWVVTRWAEMPDSDPYVSDDSECGEPSYSLTQWNDDERADFRKIADLIEKNL